MGGGGSSRVPFSGDWSLNSISPSVTPLQCLHLPEFLVGTRNVGHTTSSQFPRHALTAPSGPCFSAIPVTLMAPLKYVCHNHIWDVLFENAATSALPTCLKRV